MVTVKYMQTWCKVSPAEGLCCRNKLMGGEKEGSMGEGVRLSAFLTFNLQGLAKGLAVSG